MESQTKLMPIKAVAISSHPKSFLIDIVTNKIKRSSLRFINNESTHNI